MSDLKYFLKKNKVEKENALFAATKSLMDEEGCPLMWEVRHLSTKENEDIRESCTYEVAVTGKPNMFRAKMNSSKYIAKMMVASIITPNLYNAELQDSYGVGTPEQLLQELLDDPGEYNDFAAFIQTHNGFNNSMQDKVDEAKN